MATVPPPSPGGNAPPTAAAAAAAVVAYTAAIDAANAVTDAADTVADVAAATAAALAEAAQFRAMIDQEHVMSRQREQKRKDYAAAVGRTINEAQVRFTNSMSVVHACTEFDTPPSSESTNAVVPPAFVPYVLW